MIASAAFAANAGITACVFIAALPRRLPDADIGPGILLVELFASAALAVGAVKGHGLSPPVPKPPPPGWYADPSGRAGHRFWDGTRWTEHQR